MRSRLFLAFVILWMVAMTWRLYPQFKDAIRVDGRLTTVSAFIDDACGQRVGPAVATCLAEAGEQARLLLRSEQGKSILVIIAPVALYSFAVGAVHLLQPRSRSRHPG